MQKSRQYYQRLYHARHGQSGPARLEQVAEQLCCSPRHARAVLATLAAHGWLQWQAGRGRGQLSQLQFHTHPATLEADALQQHLARGDIESAMQQLTPASRQRLGELLPAYLGVQPGSEQRLRIPFYRPLHSLDPVQINRRTECHLIRQLFDGLTCYQRDSGRIEPALAHHWQHDASLQQWRFVLRPGVLFHHGRPLEGEDVRQTLYRLRDEPGPFQRLFAHLVSVQLPAPRNVQITLSQPDALLPHRLADHCAVILPRERWPQADFGRQPSGTGPFRLSVNNAHRATLRAFERYWQARPLLDEVDIWVVNDDATRARLDVRLGYHGQTPPQGQYTLQAEPGCSYVCANPATLDAGQRAALAAWLHPAQWPADLGGQRALGMLAQWQHWPAPQAAARPAIPPRLRLVTYKLATHVGLAEQVCARLAAAGCQVTLQVLDFPEFAANHWRHSADLMLTGEVLGDDLDYSCYQWLAGESGFHPWLSDATRHALQTWVGRSQAEPDSATRWQHYAAAASLLVREHGLIPLQHSTMRLEFDPQLRGIALSQCGWMDFRQLWFDSAA